MSSIRDYKVSIINDEVGETELGACAGGNSGNTPTPSNTLIESTLSSRVTEGKDGN